MPELVNPLAAYRDAYSLLEGQAQDRAQRQAGNALAGGDYGGAQAALYGRGMLQEGQAVGAMQRGLQDREAAQQAAQQEASKKATLESYTMLGQAAQGLTRVPDDQRRAYLDTVIVPSLQARGASPEIIAALSDPSHDLSDQSLQAFMATLGQEADKLQIVPRGNGGYDVTNMGTGGIVRSVEPTAKPERMRGPDGIYERNMDGEWERVEAFGPAPRQPPRGPGGSRAAPSIGGGAPRSLGSGDEPEWYDHAPTR